MTGSCNHSNMILGRPLKALKRREPASQEGF